MKLERPDRSERETRPADLLPKTKCLALQFLKTCQRNKDEVAADIPSINTFVVPSIHGINATSCLGQGVPSSAGLSRCRIVEVTCRALYVILGYHLFPLFLFATSTFVYATKIWRVNVPVRAHLNRAASRLVERFCPKNTLRPRGNAAITS